jgi:uncharacterized protein YecA (UPF0149 family)
MSGGYRLAPLLAADPAFLKLLEPAAAPTRRSLRIKRGAATVVRTGPKHGRNDPCPCNSGRKFKRCHGRRT